MIIQKASVILLFLIFFLQYPVAGQDSKVITGVLSFQEQDYTKAMADLDQALYYPKELSKKNLVKAYYYRALTFVYMYNNAVAGNREDLLAAFPDAYLDAYRDLQRARVEDDGTWEKRIAIELEELHPGLLQNALLYLNKAIDLQDDPRYLFERSLEYSRAANTIKKSYLCSDIEGQALMGLELFDQAAVAFEGSINIYADAPPELPDFLQGYVYYRLADINLRHLDNAIKAMEILNSGLSFLDEELARYRQAAVSAGGRPGDYNNAVKDLEKFRLELYLRTPELRGEGIEAFRRAVEKEPGNYDLRVAYASLLEEVDFDGSVRQYEKAIELDPAHDLAWFNAGVVRYNKARNLYQQASQVIEDEKYEMLMGETEKYFSEAKPYFEKVLEINRGNLTAVTALKNISMVLNDADGYEKYTRLEKELGNGR